MPVGRMIRSTRRPLPATVLVLMLGSGAVTGCASGPSASGAWTDGSTGARSYSRVLVVGVSPDINQRCPFERMLAGRLKSSTTEAFASCDAVAQRNPLTRESIEAAVAAKNADVVVATSLVARDWELQQGGTADTRGGGMYKATGSGWATGYYGLYGVPVIYGEFQTAPSALTLQGEIRLTSRVYDTADKKLVYTIDTVARDIETREQAAHEISIAISDRLRKDGLVR
jgi:hypothetical protein